MLILITARIRLTKPQSRAPQTIYDYAKVEEVKLEANRRAVHLRSRATLQTSRDRETEADS